MGLNVTGDDLQLARATGVSAARFEAAFDRARPSGGASGGAAGGPVAFSALSHGNSASVEKIASAIALARRDGWLDRLMAQFLTGGEAAAGGAAPDIAGLVNEVQRQGLAADGSKLQSIVDPRRGFVAAGLEAYHLPRIIRQVCRIDIDGQARGTGFLVHPEVVLTAYHVVQDLTAQEPDEPVEAAPGSGERLRIVFDDIDVLRNGFSVRQDGFAVPVAENWLVHASRCHKLELLNGLPKDLSELQTRLDFALVRLDRVARVGIPPVAIGAGAVVKGDRIVVFQHRQGQSLAFDRAEVTALHSDWRFEHGVNTEGGSSGSPCFDASYQVVGLHHAGRGLALAADRNRAVPLRAVKPAIDQLGHASSRPAPMLELTEGQPGQPVLGRAETQNWVWQQLQAEQRHTLGCPILALRGLPGSGKSFTFDLLRSLLPRTHHDVVRLAAGEDIQQRTPEDFAALLLRRLEYPAMQDLRFEANTERIRWLMATHLPALLTALDAGRRGRPDVARGVWLVLDDLDTAAIGSETDISAYLYGLYAATSARAWLRVVLLGFDGSLTEDLLALSESHDLTLPTDDDLAGYLKAKLPPQLYADPDAAIGPIIRAVRDSTDELPRAKQLRAVQRRVAKAAGYWAERR